MSASVRDEYAEFEPDAWSHVLGGLVARHPRGWIRLGNLETRVVADAVADLRVERPIYVSGLARAGTTILLEALADHSDTATHRYRDYPFVFTPCWWNRFLDRMPRRETPAIERSHRDGIRITPESPEAFEEMLWMAFFPDAHDSGKSQVLDGKTANPEFEAFYFEHIRKLLLLRGAGRYLAKGNYNLTRLEYLLKLFPEARFVVALREPRWHIASLAKQHALFCAAEKAHPRALAYMRRVGHFEFGLDRRPINAGNAAATVEVQARWREGREIEGWARYWADLYGHIADRLEANAALREAALVVRYEDLCREPRETLVALFEHCRLGDAEEPVARMADGIHFPSYYDPRFDAEELATIARHTEGTARRFGYESFADAR